MGKEKVKIEERNMRYGKKMKEKERIQMKKEEEEMKFKRIR